MIDFYWLKIYFSRFITMVLAYHRISRTLFSGGSLLLKNDQGRERKKPIFNDRKLTGSRSNYRGTEVGKQIS